MAILLQHTSLNELAEAYFADETLQVEFKDVEKGRAQKRPTLQKFTEQFIQGEINLSTLRDQLQWFLTNVKCLTLQRRTKSSSFLCSKQLTFVFTHLLTLCQ